MAVGERKDALAHGTDLLVHASVRTPGFPSQVTLAVDELLAGDCATK